MYNPLPKCIKIKKSKIHGYGIFAATFIPKGFKLGISHVENKDFPNGYIRTPLGGFYNHSEEPTCKLIDADINGTPIKILKTLIDIDEDVELTCTYTIWNINELDEVKNIYSDWLGL